MHSTTPAGCLQSWSMIEYSILKGTVLCSAVHCRAVWRGAVPNIDFIVSTCINNTFKSATVMLLIVVYRDFMSFRNLACSRLVLLRSFIGPFTTPFFRTRLSDLSQFAT